MTGRAVLAALACLVPAACGDGTVPVDELEGDMVGARAERQLQAQNPSLAPGTLDCPDLDFEVGEAVRCVRTTELSDGRVVKVMGTVKVTAREDGGRVHVVMDEQALEFGLSGEQLENDLRALIQRRTGSSPGAVECPYLRGEVGVRVSCRVDSAGSRTLVDVSVTAVDAEDYRTRWVARTRRP